MLGSGPLTATQVTCVLGGALPAGSYVVFAVAP